MSSNSPILLCLPQGTEESEDLGLPIDSENIFQRLIRNPHLDSDTPRERECTEMLCSVLCNSPVLRRHFLQWLGNSVGDLPDNLDDLEFQIDTEGAIGSKRDDLRIEGWRQTEDGQKLILVWTVEVKVGARFHESSFQDEASDAEASDLVNQLVNYDLWLREQPAEYRAGFVLALNDMNAELPPNLAMPWHCFTWTQVGLQIEEALEQDDLPATEDFLAKHLLGFIKNHLWRLTDMSHDRLEFDDIALIRAFNHIGIDCDKKLTRLVGYLSGLLEESEIGVGRITQQNVIFRPTLRTVVCRQLFDADASSYPFILMGIEKDDLVIALETPPSNEKKAAFHQAVNAILSNLHEFNSNWHAASLEDRSSWDLELKSPLLDLLVTEDQEASFISFFRKALADLKECGVVEALEACIG